MAARYGGPPLDVDTATSGAPAKRIPNLPTLIIKLGIVVLVDDDALGRGDKRDALLWIGSAGLFIPKEPADR